MTTNFFQNLTSLNIEGDWQMSIKKNEQGQVIVSVLLTNEKAEDGAKKLIPPMIFKGTPEELDNGFFESMKTPAEKTSQLFQNMEEYSAQLAKAKEESKMKEENTKKEKTARDEKKRKYEAQMKKVSELEEKEKWGEAIGAMPKADQFPDMAEEIKDKLDELRKKHGSLELFS